MALVETGKSESSPYQGNIGVGSNIDPTQDPQLIARIKKLKFIPNPGPQTDAYLSKADILLFGGAAGGGKSALAIGLALQEHERTLIIRKQYADLSGILDDLVKFNGTRDGLTTQPRPKLITNDGKKIEFGALNHPGDEFDFQGSPKDLIYFDEASQLQENMVRFVMGWNRTVTKGQRCRIIFGTNPPVSSDGDWLISMFAPWLDPKYPRPAKPGELRWFITNEYGKDEEVDGPEPIVRGADNKGEPKSYIPKSRTFIPSSLSDNPYLRDTGYAATLDAMPEPYRSAMRDGNFALSRKDSLFQMIPTNWVMEAQRRWLDHKGVPPIGIPMCAIGADCAGGGKDKTVIARRYDYFYDKLIEIPGRETPNSQGIAAQVMIHRKDNSDIVIDMGGGYGGEPYTLLRENIDNNKIHAFKGAEGTSVRTKDRIYGFTNVRSAAYWKFKEALDPSQPGGSPIMLPDDRELLAELTAVDFEITTRGIKAEPKDKVMDKLGRSPDKADAVVMAWWIGQKGLQPNMVWGGSKNFNRNTPKVVLGYENRRRK